jgi:hypothetical protein
VYLGDQRTREPRRDGADEGAQELENCRADSRITCALTNNRGWSERPMIVNTKTPRRLHILIVDVTRNSHDFEHDVSTTIAQRLRSLGVAVTKNSPEFISNDDEFNKTLTNAGTDFNCLLLVAHGGSDPGNGDVCIVEGPSGNLDWHSLVEFTENLQDKFVALYVCHGYCEDTTCAFVTATSLCLSLVAPEAELTADEASSFFPDFLKAVDSVRSKASIQMTSDGRWNRRTDLQKKDAPVFTRAVIRITLHPENVTRSRVVAKIIREAGFHASEQKSAA